MKPPCLVPVCVLFCFPKEQLRVLQFFPIILSALLFIMFILNDVMKLSCFFSVSHLLPLSPVLPQPHVFPAAIMEACAGSPIAVCAG